MKRTGLAMVFGLAAAAQVDLRIEARMRRGENEPEQTMGQQRIRFSGEIIRVEYGGGFLLFRPKDGSMVLVDPAGGTYTEGSQAEFEAVRAARSRPLPDGVSLKRLEAAAPAAFEWNGQKTTARACRFQMTITNPQLPQPAVMVQETITYTVPLEGPIKEVLDAQSRLGLSSEASQPAEWRELLKECLYSGEFIVRSITKSEMGGKTAMTLSTSIQVDPNPTLDPRLFRVPEEFSKSLTETFAQAFQRLTRSGSKP